MKYASILLRSVLGYRVACGLPSDKTHLLTYDAIGDTCMLLAYVDSFERVYGGRFDIVCTSNKAKVIEEYLGRHVDVMVIDKPSHDSLLRFLETDVGVVWRRKHRNVITTYMPAWIRSDALHDDRYISDCLDTVRAAMRLPRGTRPRFNAASSGRGAELVGEYGLRPGRTILLCPAANSMRLGEEVFLAIAEALRGSGYDIATDVSAGCEALPGTTAVTYGLDDAVSFVEACGTVIGLRSGFFDWIANAHARKLVIYSKDFFMWGYCSLGHWNPDVPAHEYCYDGDLTGLIEWILLGLR